MEKENLLLEQGNDCRNLCLQISALHHLKGLQPSPSAKVQAPQGLTENSTLKRQLSRPRARSAPAERGWSLQKPEPKSEWLWPRRSHTPSQGFTGYQDVTFHSSVALLALVMLHSRHCSRARGVPSMLHIDRVPGAAIASSRSSFSHLQPREPNSLSLR